MNSLDATNYKKGEIQGMNNVLIATADPAQRPHGEKVHVRDGLSRACASGRHISG